MTNETCPTCGSPLQVNPSQQVVCPKCSVAAPPPPPVAAPWPAVQVATARRTRGGKGLAVASLFCALFSILFGALAGLAAVILGIIALAKRTPGRGFAIAGLVLGIMLPAAQLAILLPVIAHYRMQAIAMKSSANLRGIAQTTLTYSASNRDMYPPDLDMLVANKYFGTDLLVSPLSGRQPPAFNNGKIIGETDYVYMAGLDGDCDQNCVVAYERPENYGGKETAVAYLDGHVSKVDVTTLEQQLARTKAEIAKVAARRASSPH